MLQLTGALCSTGNAVITENSLCFLKGLLEMRRRVVYGNSLIKRGHIGLRESTEILLTINSVQNTGDMGYMSGEWDETESNDFISKEPDYNIMMISTF